MEPIEKVSSVEQAERQIREYILSDEVQIGEKLPTEKQLCQTLSVGRGTVREAIRLLQAKGLVELRPGRGAFIASKSEQDSEDIADWFRKNEIQVKDLIDVRLVIEPLAAKLALKRCDAKDVEHLREILAESEQAAAEADNVKLAVCDEKFHTFIFECTRNKLLIDINRKIERSLITFRNKTFTIPQPMCRTSSPRTAPSSTPLKPAAGNGGVLHEGAHGSRGRGLRFQQGSHPRAARHLSALRPPRHAPRRSFAPVILSAGLFRSAPAAARTARPASVAGSGARVPCAPVDGHAHLAVAVVLAGAGAGAVILALIFFLKRPGEGVLQAVPLGIVALMEHDHGFLFHGISVDQQPASSVRSVLWIENGRPKKDGPLWKMALIVIQMNPLWR